jgi:hypothetical protein
MQINLYQCGHQQFEEWNGFVAKSKNGTFLFDRRFMDYHADRFQDYSLMFYDKDRLLAVMPAHVDGDTLVSHGGLTYGGLVMGPGIRAVQVCEIFRELNEVLRWDGFRRVIYKAVPWIYHQQPAEEDLYALTSVCHARLIIRDISSAIIGDRKMRFSGSRKDGIRKARRRGLIMMESMDFDAFWQILNDNLTSKYGIRPVHSAEELKLLHSRFPDKIRLYMVFEGEEPFGGTILFLTPQVLHTQYISATPEGKACGAIDLLFDHLINTVYSDYRYIDFGKSTSSNSADLNENLIFQKEGFGARAVCYDTYEWTL